jgi:carboxy-terminal domain RNA polymerase II polypeptide A small phosphatase
MFGPFRILVKFCSCHSEEAAEEDRSEGEGVGLLDVEGEKMAKDGGVARETEPVKEEPSREGEHTRIIIQSEDSIVVYREDAPPGKVFGEEHPRPRSKSNEAVEQDCLLPRKNDRKPTLVLDLDQTLVYSTFEVPRSYDFTVKVSGSPNSTIYVKTRPFAVEFIKKISSKFEIVIFTAAKKEYAQAVVKEIDKSGCISHILYRESCTLYNGKYIKDLSKLGRSLNNVLLVDDIPYSYQLQPQNGIHIPPYVGEADDALFELMRFLGKVSDLGNLMDHSIKVPFKVNAES